MKRIGLWAAFALLGLAGGSGNYAGGQGPGKRPMTFADLMAMKRVSDPQISPSGKWVMFSVADVSLEKNTKVNHLWVVPLNPTHDDKTVMNGAPERGGSTKYEDSSPSAQNDTPKNERQVTSGDGETNGRFSPDGNWVSMTLKDQVYLAPWDEAAGKVGEAKPLTSVAGGADGAIWSPDSRRLLFTAQVYPECSVKGGDAALKKLEPFDGKAVVGGSLKVAAWKGLEPAAWADEEACDKTKDEAAEKSPVKATIFDGLLYRHWDHWTGEKRTHIFVVDADGKNVRDLTPANEVGDAETPTFMVGGPQEYAWAPDSKEIAYVTNLDPVPAASTNNDVFTLSLDEPGAKALKVSTSPGSDDEPEYSPDGKWLAWRSQARGGFESDRFRLIVAQRVSGSASQQVSGREWSEPKEVMPKFDRWVDEFTWAPDSKAMYLVAGDAGLESVLRMSLPSGGLIAETSNGEYSDVRVSPDGLSLIASKMTVASPIELYSVRLLSFTEFSPNASRHFEPGAPVDQVVSDRKGALMGSAAEDRITNLNGRLVSALDLGHAESFWFTGAEGTKVEGFLLKPPNFDPAKKYPLKFLMHGGPQTAWGDSWSYRWNWELMAASGYVVIGINRRGSTGYGQKFVDEVSGDWGGRAYEDLRKGLDYAEAHYSFIDKDRECALGASYGGYMANWVLTHTNRFKCIVTHDGLYDPAAAWGATEEMWFGEWEFRTPRDYPKGWDGFSGSNPTSQKRDVGHPATNPTHGDKPAVNGAPERSGMGHPAEPWRYENLPADQDPFRKWSPMRFIANAKTPTLIIHSQKDMRLDVSQGFEMFTALQRLGVPSKMLYFPDEGHWVLKPQNSQLWNEVVSDWCDRWTHSGKYAESK